ncbi:MAG: hypothetical protein QOE68_3934, partial [Thermoanaerobaculia bacterium]|nr:hypothetical protein [Thermoanaerobaculia bacterium]
MTRFARLQQRQQQDARRDPARPSPANDERRGQRSVSISNQRMQRRLRQASARQRENEQKPPDLENQATEIVEILRTDSEDQSGQARHRIESFPPDERAQVMGRLQDKMSETEMARVSPALARPAPHVVEEGPSRTTPSPEARTAEPPREKEAEALVSEEPTEEKKGEEEKKEEPEAKKKEKEKKTKTDEPQTGGVLQAPRTEPEAKATTPPTEESPAASGGTKPELGAKPMAAAAAIPHVEAPATAKQKPKEASASDRKQSGDAAASTPGQETPAKVPETAGAPVGSRTAVRGVGAPAGPAAATAAAAPAAGFAGGGGGDVALEDAPAESPEAEETEEKMSAAEKDEDAGEIAEPEPQEEMSAEKALAESDRASPAEMEQQQKEAEEQDAVARAGGEEPEDEEDAPPADAVALPAAERDAALASIGESKGGGGAPGGGGGGGSAMPAPPTEAAPDVAGAPPAEAMASVSSLKVGQIAGAISGISQSVDSAVSDKKSELAENPPEMQRPSGAPRTKSIRGVQEGGGEAPGAKGVRKPTPEGKTKSAKDAIPEPAALPPSPTDEVEAPRVAGGEGGEVSAAEAENLRGAVEDVPTSDPALNETAGPPPTVDLTGDANPALAQEQRTQLDETTSHLEIEGARDVRQKRGEDQLYPTMPEETLTAAPAAGSAATAVTAVDADDETASIVAEAKDGNAVRAKAASAQADMVTADEEQAQNEATERSDHETKVQEAIAENEAQQTERRQKAAGDVDTKRGQWTADQRDMVTEQHGDADAAMADADATVETEQTTANDEAAAKIQKGNDEATAARENAEREAREEKRKSDEDSEGFFGWLASKAKAAFNALVSAIGAIFDAARNLVKTAIHAAQKLAAFVIDKARDAIVAAIHVAGDICAAAADVLLAGFPELRDRVKGAIRATVSAAEDAVNALADALKRGIQKLLDFYLKALDALLSLLEKGLKAAVQLVAAFVDGVIKAAKALATVFGALWQIIKDVASGPLEWLSNLGAAIVDGIQNHLWTALKTAVSEWFNAKLDAVLGLGTAVWNALKKGSITVAEVGKMAFEALKAALPTVLVRLLIEKLVAMIIPAAGAVMAIVEGLQAAWGTISQIFAAIGRFFDFLKAVKSGNAGPKFANVVAAAAVVVIEFVSNWLLARLVRPAMKVGQKIKAMAGKIMAKLKKAGQKIANKAMAKVKKGLKKLGLGKKKGTKKSRTKKDKEKAEDRLTRAERELDPKINARIAKGTPAIVLRSMLFIWKRTYRLSQLSLDAESGVITMAANPVVKKRKYRVKSPFLRRIANECVMEIIHESPDVEAATAGMTQAGTADDPIQIEPGIGTPALIKMSEQGRLAGFADPSTGGRPTRTYEMGVGEDRTRIVEELGVGKGDRRNAKVLEAGTYAGMPRLLKRLGDAAGGMSQKEMAIALRTFEQTGRMPLGFNVEQKQQFASIAFLLFKREGIRGPQTAVEAMMMLDMLASGA